MKVIWRQIDDIDKKHSNIDLYKILETMKKINDDSYYKKKRGERTKYIKSRLAILGHEREYKVLTNGIKEFVPEINKELHKSGKKFKFKCTEWLYDLQWYTEPDNCYEENCGYITERFPLALECEWDKRRKDDNGKNSYSAMKYDLQKVIGSTADLQVMIFLLSSIADIDEIDKHFKKVITHYENRKSNATVVGIGVCNRKRMMYYCLYENTQHSI